MRLLPSIRTRWLIATILVVGIALGLDQFMYARSSVRYHDKQPPVREIVTTPSGVFAATAYEYSGLGGIFRLDSESGEWRRLDLAPAGVNSLAAVPGSDELIAGWIGLFSSDDNGDNWRHSDVLRDHSVVSIAPTRRGVLTVARSLDVTRSSLFLVDSTLTAAAEMQSPMTTPTAVGVDILDENRVALVGSREESSSGQQVGVLALSDDGGNSWGSVLDLPDLPQDVVVSDGRTVVRLNGDAGIASVVGDEVTQQFKGQPVSDISILDDSTILVARGREVWNSSGGEWTRVEAFGAVELALGRRVVTGLAEGGSGEYIASDAFVRPAGRDALGRKWQELTGDRDWGERRSRYLPRTSEQQPIGDGDLPSAVIFYSPHPDDETWAMSYTIQAYLRKGVPVYGVLLSDGEAGGIFELWYRQHPEVWRDNNGDGVAGDRFDFALERRREYTRAMVALGVPEENLVFEGAGDKPGSGIRNKGFFIGDVIEVMREMSAEHPDAIHFTTTRYTDGRWDGVGDIIPSADHTTAAEALRFLAMDGDMTAAFFKVYPYRLENVNRRWAPGIVVSPDAHDLKLRAMEEGFGRLDPENGYLALGRQTSDEFYEQIIDDPREWRVDMGAF